MNFNILSSCIDILCSEVRGAVDFVLPYISGYSDDTFRPEASITRAEIATILSQVLDLNLSYPGNPKFSDVTEKAWYYKYAQAVERTGIFKGYGNGQFKPESFITRGELAAVFSNYWNFLNIEVDNSAADVFTDVSSHWAHEHIYRLYHAGILNGFNTENYRPDDYATRAEVVVMINALIGRAPLNSEIPTFKDVDKEHWAYGAIEAAANANLVTEE